ncbi:hypothetical protein QR90_08855 [Deinococcus radiopugnans]|uniref:Uncharacterized protein n=1 Tax=Deinococcus radiopugnans TaxID=57497 RepID=A0A0A7KG89_9DEIO|nr:hypothetical protein [Deinococcus radiopugnans]AIZ45187.1 hypothetical protein QR90_08855 [Deinococcus radiopugnans]
MRTVVLGPATLPEARGTVLTLNRRAAARLGASAQRLDAFARRLVLDTGQDIAPATLAQRLLTCAVRDALGVPDPGLVARSLGGPLRELLRGSADLEALRADPSPQVRRLAVAAAAYRAAQLAVPQLLSVFRYVRLSADELLLIDAAAVRRRARPALDGPPVLRGQPRRSPQPGDVLVAGGA